MVWYGMVWYGMDRSIDRIFFTDLLTDPTLVYRVGPSYGWGQLKIARANSKDLRQQTTDRQTDRLQTTDFGTSRAARAANKCLNVSH